MATLTGPGWGLPSASGSLIRSVIWAAVCRAEAQIGHFDAKWALRKLASVFLSARRKPARVKKSRFMLERSFNPVGLTFHHAYGSSCASGFESAASASNYFFISSIATRRWKLCKKLCKFRLFYKNQSRPRLIPWESFALVFGEGRGLDRSGGLSGT